MANHLRRQIREAVGTAVTSLSTTGANVFQSRVYPLQTSELPGLLIYTRRETSDPITIHPSRVIERRLMVVVEGITKAVADLDDTLDQIAKEVETALAWPVSGLTTIAKDISLRSTEIDLEDGVEKPTGRVRMTFAVDYCNVEATPDIAV